MALPAMRQINAFPVDHEGQQFICLHDPEGIVPDQLMLAPPAFFIACHLDGKNDILDIQYAFARHFDGQLLTSADVQSLVATLDKHGFLHTDRFVTLQKQIEAAFTAAETRPAYLAGKSYPDQAEQLRVFLDGLFDRENGPGERPGTHDGTGRPARCLIVPHIDFHRGGYAYAHGYLQLCKYGQPVTVFLFGVAHASPPVPFILTQKHFDTPFGVLETDRDIVRRLESVCTWDPYAYEAVHRTEHSIEFQAVMLSYLYGPTVRIVPILCATFGPEIMPTNGTIPEPVTTFLETCREIISSAPQPVSVIAGADLAHVGRRFGDPFDIDGTIVNMVATRDRQDLQHVTAGDADGFYQSVMQDQNQRRVCGLNCIYAALKAVDGVGNSGDLLHYDYAHDPAGGIVSFADVLFA
jgi:AmmeMemoRadiSam system protein B